MNKEIKLTPRKGAVYDGQLDLSEWKPGFYIVQIYNEDTLPRVVAKMTEELAQRLRMDFPASLEGARR